MVMFTLNEITYYEESDIASRIGEERDRAMEGARNLLRAENRVDTIAVFKQEVAEGSMTDEDACELFNKVAIACGWETAEVSDLRTRFRAEVTLFGSTVMEIVDIEADDEDDAKQKVLDDISFDEVILKVNMSSLGDQGDYRDSTWELDDFLQEHVDCTIYED
jgi:hypothetical protein